MPFSKQRLYESPCRSFGFSYSPAMAGPLKLKELGQRSEFQGAGGATQERGPGWFVARALGAGRNMCRDTLSEGTL